MREIKFRAWDKKTNYMRFVADLALRPYGSQTKVTDGDAGGHYEVDDHSIELMQYTGLKDKNGKEIYEGDVIKITYHEEDEGFQHSRTIHIPVEWQKTQASFNLAEHTDGFLNGELEIIGNIYENPNLLA